ncbi:hypothetical protein Efla_004408 [Eimeria flavescens]
MRPCVSLFFSTRRGLQAPLLKELQAIPWLPKISAAPRLGDGASREGELLERRPEQQPGRACHFVVSPGGVLLQHVPYVRPLSALPLLRVRVASIDSPIADSRSLRSSITVALEEAAAQKAVEANEAMELTAAESPSAAAEAALAAAAHQLRVVCVQRRSVVDLQLSAHLDPRPYRYLPHLPAAPGAASGIGEAAAFSLAASELRSAAFIAEAQQAFGQCTASANPLWSLKTEAVAAATAASLPAKALSSRIGGGFRHRQQLLECNVPQGRHESNDRSSGSSSNNSNSPSPSELLASMCKGVGWSSNAYTSGTALRRDLLPRSAATVSMLRLLYLKEGGASEALAGATAADAAATVGTEGAAAFETAEKAAVASAALWRWGRAVSDDGDVTLAAAVAAAGLQRIFRREKRLVLWDPFCGTGGLLLEAALLLSELPPSNPDIPAAVDLIPALASDAREPESLLQGQSAARADTASAKVPQITLVGTDERFLLLQAARQRLRRFCRFFFAGHLPLDLETQQQQGEQEHQEDAEPSVRKQQKPPFAIGLHLASPFDLSPHVSGGIIFTRIPCPREAKLLRSARGKPLDLYEKFGKMIASRSDWRGVFVIVRSSAFKHHSRLEWESLLRWRDVSGKKVALLRWTGRKHSVQRLDMHHERLGALDAQDLQTQCLCHAAEPRSLEMPINGQERLNQHLN